MHTSQVRSHVCPRCSSKGSKAGIRRHAGQGSPSAVRAAWVGKEQGVENKGEEVGAVGTGPQKFPRVYGVWLWYKCKAQHK